MRCFSVYSRVAVFLACSAVIAFHLCHFIHDVLENPVGTTTEMVQPPKLEKLVFCTEPTYEASSPEAWPLGFYLGANPKWFEETNSRELRRSWLKKVVNQTRFVAAMQPIFGKFEAGKPKGWRAGLAVEPLHVDVAKVCSVHDQPSIYSHYDPSWYSLESSTAFVWYQPHFNDSSSQQMVLSLSLYNTEYGFQHLGAADFMHIKVDSTYKKYAVALSATLKKSRYLNRDKEPCKKVKHGYLHPIGYLVRKCKMECSLEAHRVARNCTPFQLYKRGEDPENICHQISAERKTKDSQRDAYNASFQECQAKRQCDRRRYCEEWDISLEEALPPDKMQLMSENAGQKDGEKRIAVYILVKSKLEFSKEYFIYPWETILGNVGGIIGIYLGLSVFGIWELATAVCRAKEEKRNAT